MKEKEKEKFKSEVFYIIDELYRQGVIGGKFRDCFSLMANEDGFLVLAFNGYRLELSGEGDYVRVGLWHEMEPDETIYLTTIDDLDRYNCTIVAMELIGYFLYEAIERIQLQ